MLHQLPEAEAAAHAAPLVAALAGLAETAGTLSREAALGTFRRHLARIQAQVRETFEQGEITGLQAGRQLAGLTDGLVKALFAHASAEMGGIEALCVVATGGYGRGTLAPFSDIDLLFLTPHQASSHTHAAVEYMLYFLWDLGLKVGHATRSVAECLHESARDLTIRTALLDARFLVGDAALFESFHKRFRAACKEAGAAEFIAAKQAEREARHRRFGDSPFVVEPNIKEGRGGLRDLQTLYWIARYMFDTYTMGELSDVAGVLSAEEARHARRSWEFLWTLRFHLHYVAGRAEERLTFDLQPVVGARMGYTRHGRQDGVERFMRHYFLTAREIARLTRVVEPAILRVALGPPAVAAETDKALIEAGFVLAEGQLMPMPGRDFDTDPIQMLRILKVARDRDLALHPLALRGLIRTERAAAKLRGNAEAADLFMDLLCGHPPETNRDGGHNPDGARWLAILNETGILGRFLPDWGRIVGQMQFDTYHIFTVDEHTIEAVRVLNTLERGELAEVAPVASGVIDHIQSRRALYLAMLMHDIAKGRGGDHSRIGAELALEVGPALGLTAEETETVSWLVLYHLMLSETAFKRDIDDPKTILDLADTIQSPERLRLLLILTVADMRAVSKKVWNGWKATLLRELYTRVAEVLEGGLATTERDVRVARAKEAVASLLADWPEDAIADFTALGYPGYWLSFDPETQARHARLIREAERRDAPLTVHTEPLPARAVTEVTVYCADHAGLFSKISGALAVAGASIVDARIHTMTNGMALDTFWVQDAAGGTFDAPHRLARLSALIEQALSGRLRLATEIPKLSAKMLIGRRMRAIHVPPRVVIDNRASNSHTVLEVNGRDRPGLLHDVTAAISEQGLQIASAHVTTYGVRAVDVFYVKDVFGLKVTNEAKLRQLRAALLDALATPEDPPASAPAEALPRRRRRTAG
ncbi:MAG: [protein-PII] uridylyltransferase [Rhodospirillales bacterium]|nr:[protein-PII] uridylyltransferase [Rhodospirillales bacterium]